MKIGGLASGIDTESIINDMMEAHRLPLNKITQQKQYLEWQLNDYRTINRDIRAMSDNLFDTMMKSSTFMAKTVSVSNESAISIRSLNASSEFSGEIEVKQLAKAASWQNMGKEGLTMDHKMSDLIEGLSESGSAITITTPDGQEKTIDFAADDTIKSVIEKMNKEGNVTAFFDEHTGKIAMTAKNSGDGDIVVSGLGEGTSVEGQNAKFTFNGLETERSSNTFEINGFEITLKEVTSNPVSFSSAPDTDKVVDAVKQFVDDYNELIENLNQKVREPKYRDFPPLSADQKAAMKEKEIELWEEKAMSGTLRNDPTIQSLLSNMRMALSSSVETSNGRMSLADIGITTSKDYLSNGKLEINEEKLREVISENPNSVHELFASNGEDAGEKGIATQTRDSLREANRSITNRAGSFGSGKDSFTLGRNLKEMDKQIERFQDRMETIESRYWKQFTAMEQAMQRANAQAEQLMNALGGGMM